MPAKKDVAHDAPPLRRQLLLEGRLLKSFSRSLARVSFATPRFWPGFEYPSFGWIWRAGRRIPARLTGWWAGRAYYTVIGPDVDLFLKRAFWRPLTAITADRPQLKPAPAQNPRAWAGLNSAQPGLNYLTASQAEAWSVTGAEAIKTALKQKRRVLVLTPSLPWLTTLLSAGGHWPVSPVYLGEADESGPLASYSAAGQARRLAEEAGGRLAEAREKTRAHLQRKEALKAALAKYAELENLEAAWRDLSQEALKLRETWNAQKAVVSEVAARWREYAASHKKQRNRWWWPFGRRASLATIAEEARRLKEKLEAAEFKARKLRSEQKIFLERARENRKILEDCRAKCRRAGPLADLQAKLKAAELLTGTLGEWQRRIQEESNPPGGLMAHLLRGPLVLAHAGHLKIGEPLFQGRFNLLVAIGPTGWLRDNLDWAQLTEKAPQALVIDIGDWPSARARSRRSPGSFSSWLGLKEGRGFQAPWRSPPPISQSWLTGLKNYAWPPNRPGQALNMAAAYWAASAARWLKGSDSAASAAKTAGYVFCANRPQARLTGRLLADFEAAGFQCLPSSLAGNPPPADFLIIDDLALLAPGVALATERLAVLASRSWLKRRLNKLPGAENWGVSGLEPLGRDNLASGPGVWRALPELAALSQKELLLFLPPLAPHFWSDARGAFLGALKRGLWIRLLTAPLDRNLESEYTSEALKEAHLAGLGLTWIPEAPWPQAVIDRRWLAWSPQGEAGPGKLWLTFEAPGAAAFWLGAIMRSISRG